MAMDDIVGVCDDFDERDDEGAESLGKGADARGTGGSRSISLRVATVLGLQRTGGRRPWLTMQWYQALLVIKTFRAGDHISVGELAEQLMIRDHSAASWSRVSFKPNWSSAKPIHPTVVDRS